MRTRIVIADDHVLVRAGITALLSDIPEVKVVGEASDGFEAVKMASDLNPDVLFMDLSMPGMTGLQALAEINESKPDVKIVILSMHGGEEHVLRALKLGAMGFMLKDVAPEELRHAIESINRGNTWLSAAVSKTVISSYLTRSGYDEPPVLLTARQSQVLKLIAEGFSTKDIGSALSLSVKTIETYRAQLMDKLDIHDIPGLVRYAIRNGIIPL